MAPRILPAGPERIDELRPLWRLYERRGLVPGWLQLYRLTATTR
jgi:hypothetical protein